MKRAFAAVLCFAVSTAATAEERPPAREAVAEVGVHAGARGWTTAYRKSSGRLAYGVTGGWMASEWLEINASLDHARRTFTPDDLRVTNTETWLTVGPRFSFWLQFLRFFGELGGAGVLRTVSYHDPDIANAARLSPGFGLGGGVTIAIASRVGLTMRAAWRRRDDQSNILAALDVTWFFQPSRSR